MALVFHRLVQRDLFLALEYYEDMGGRALADAFFDELEGLISEIEKSPMRFHVVSGNIRRANLPRFPFHLLFRTVDQNVRILILKHHKRNPRFGLARK